MKLADIIETFISGDWGEETVAEDTPNSVFCIRGADIVPITNHCFNGIPQRFVCDKTIENKTLKAGDLIIEKSGGSPTQSTGRIVYVSEDLIKAKGNVVCSNFCTAFRVKTGWNPLYVYYYWQNVYNHGAFFNFEGKTTGIKNLQLDNALSAIDIEYLPLEKQDQIVASLASIDEKIKVNRQINDNLEAMAHQLYDYWFVQFDFPDENGRPYKSSGGMMVWNETLKQEIPNGWYVSNICKVAEILSGGTPSKAITKYWDKGTIPFFGPTDCNGNIYQLQTKDHITEEGLKHCASSLYEDGTIFITARGSIGKLVIAGTSMAMNQSCYALRSKTGEYEYLFFLTQQLIEWLKAKGNGSVFKSIISSDIEASSLCIGRENIIALYCKRVKPIFKKIKANSQEILSLIKQRDELLPLLMNGQATVNYHLSVD